MRSLPGSYHMAPSDRLTEAKEVSEMIRAASTRIQEATADNVNRDIARQAEQRISYYTVHKDEISQRLWELEQEWDVERYIEIGASSAILTGIALGTIRARRWFLIPAVVAGFVLYFGLQGWAPPVPVLRRLGVRTRSEIEQERYALKILRGDFENGDIEGKSDLERVASIMRSVTRG
jgi:hypothetical protein